MPESETVRGIRLSRNLGWSYAAWAASVLAPLIVVPFCVRFLGDRLYGEWLVILSFASYLWLANLGIGQTFSNRVAEALARGRRFEVGSLVSTAFFAYAAISVILLLAVLTLIPLDGSRILASFNATAVSALAIYIALAALALPLKVHQMMLRGFERVDQEQAIETVGAIARVAMVVTALVAGFKLMAIAIVNGCALIIGGSAAYVCANRLDSQARPRLACFSWQLLLDMVKPSAAFFALQVGWTLVLGVDNLVIGYAMGAEAVTHYAVPFRLIWVTASLFAVAVNALTPTVTIHYTRKRRDLIASGYLFSLRLALLYGTAGAAILWFVGPEFLSLWAGPDVFPGKIAFILQIIFFFEVVWVAPSSMILLATTRHYKWAKLTIFEGIVNLALSIWWVRWYGLAGVIGATLAAAFLTNAWYVTSAAMRTLRISLAQIVHHLWPAAVLAMATVEAIVVVSSRMSPADHGLWSSIFAAGEIVVPFVTLYVWVVFGPAERARLRAWFFESTSKAV